MPIFKREKMYHFLQLAALRITTIITTLLLPPGVYNHKLNIKIIKSCYFDSVTTLYGKTCIDILLIEVTTVNVVKKRKKTLTKHKPIDDY